MSDVTRILSQIESGDPTAVEELLPLVYEELRKLAAAKLAQERPGQTLQATALVHEAYLRLVGPGVGSQESEGGKGSQPPIPDPRSSTPCFHSRGHFFAAAAEAMRRILVEQARRKNRQRHGGAHRRVELDSQAEIAAGTDDQGIDNNLLALDEALELLEEQEPAAAAVVKLRYFAGMTIEETAQALEISVRSANRHWAYARAWLFQQLN